MVVGEPVPDATEAIRLLEAAQRALEVAVGRLEKARREDAINALPRLSAVLAGETATIGEAINKLPNALTVLRTYYGA